MRAIRRLFVLAITATVTWSCSRDGTGPTAAACQAETTSVEATITSGSTVAFDWSPECPVMLVLVEEESGDMWWIATPEASHGTPEQANRIAPPVVYGQPRDGMEMSDETRPLVAGQRYTLVLWRLLPAGSTAQCQMNWHGACLLTVTEFTP